MRFVESLAGGFLFGIGLVLAVAFCRVALHLSLNYGRVEMGIKVYGANQWGIKTKLKKPNGFLIWTVFNGNVFDAIVIRNFWIYRQECYLAGPGEVAWRGVPFFRKRVK